MIFSVCGLITFLGNCTFLLGYISNNSIFPEALTMEEEQKYIKKMENGDEEARKILIEHNLRLVAHVCKKYSVAKKIEFDDLVSIGSIGLIKGINTYNSKKSIKLSTYISKCIENEILMYFRSNKKTNNDVYLEEPIGKDKDDNAITLQDVIRNDERPIDEEIDNKIKKSKMFKAINNVLNDREREIIKLRYGLDGKKPKTQIDIAKKMGISRSYVSRIESKAIEKLSKEIKEKDKISWMSRNKIIIKTSIIGIIVNITLVIFKSIVGLASNSIAIISDAINNLTDVVSSIVTIIGTKLSNMAPNKKHPYGYGRIEYFTSIIIAVIILFAGITAARESINKILAHEKTYYEIVSLVVIAVAIIVKFFLAKYVKKVGKKVNSESLIGTGEEAFIDSIVSFSTLVAAIIRYIWNISLEGYLGVIISVIIINTGVEMLRETADIMLGERADKELTRKLKKTISSFEEVQGVYDLNIHTYGPSKIIAAAHIQVRDDMTAEKIHVLTRKIEYAVFNEFGIILTLGIYAANNNGELELGQIGKIKEELKKITKEYKSIIQIHGFYVDQENNNVFFDIVIDFNEKNKEQIKNEVIRKLKEKYGNYNYNVILDPDISDWNLCWYSPFYTLYFKNK